MILYTKGEEKANTIVGKAPSTGLTNQRLISPPLKGEALRRRQVTPFEIERCNCTSKVAHWIKNFSKGYKRELFTASVTFNRDPNQTAKIP